MTDTCKNCGHTKRVHSGINNGDRPEGHCVFTEEDLVTDCECNKFEPQEDNSRVDTNSEETAKPSKPDSYNSEKKLPSCYCRCPDPLPLTKDEEKFAKQTKCIKCGGITIIARKTRIRKVKNG